MTEPRGAIVIGASSGIGEALARELASEGYQVGLAARRTERLRAIGEELPTRAYVATMDVTDTADAREGFFELADAMPSVDLVVLSAGVGRTNPDLEWEPERETIETNVTGFAALATAAIEHFETEAASGSESVETASRNESGDAADDGPVGHLVGISSVTAHVGVGALPAYGASKAFVSNYLEGLRYRQAHRGVDVRITTIEPGYVDTPMAGGDFWQSSPETAAKQIARAIRKGRTHAYVTRRWRLVAWFLKATPEFVLRRLLS